jgi:hypothetical protein
MIFVFVGHTIKEIFLSLFVFLKKGSNQVNSYWCQKKKKIKLSDFLRILHIFILLWN